MKPNGSLFVKFVPFNMNTLHCFVDQTVWFSTVFDFNDFNELRYISPFNKNIDKAKFLNAFKNLENKCEIPNKLLSNGYEEEFCNDLSKWLKTYCPNEGSVPKKYWQTLLQYMAYASVGIFCASHIDIFKDDSAQLMFAHYADNLEGVALVYEYKNIKPNSVKYKDGRKYSFGGGSRVFGWIEGNYNTRDLNDFLNKSKEWKYEKEYRVFKKPGIYSTIDVGIELKTILYTPRFPQEALTSLNNLNQEIYGDKVKVSIEGIYAAHGEYKFLMLETREDVYNYLAPN